MQKNVTLWIWEKWWIACVYRWVCVVNKQINERRKKNKWCWAKSERNVCILISVRVGGVEEETKRKKKKKREKSKRRRKRKTYPTCHAESYSTSINPTSHNTWIGVPVFPRHICPPMNIPPRERRPGNTRNIMSCGFCSRPILAPACSSLVIRGGFAGRGGREIRRCSVPCRKNLLWMEVGKFQNWKLN